MIKTSITAAWSLHLILVLIVTVVLGSCSPPPVQESVPAPQSFPGPSIQSPRNDAASKSRRDTEETEMLDELDRFAAVYSLQSLRKLKDDNDCSELRVWVGFGPSITRGVLIRKCDGQLFAKYLPPLGENFRRKKGAAPMNQVVRSNGDEFWQDLKTTDLFELPDDSEIGEVEPFPDSTVVIVEIRRSAAYRSYSYASPCYLDKPESRKLIDAISLINTTIDLDFYNCSA